MDASSIKIEVIAKGSTARFPERVEDNLLRMAQEALTNVIKHASATEAVVELDCGGQQVALTINDNGKGFDPSERLNPYDGHFGLLGMSERAKRLGGNLRVTSTSGCGTGIHITIPLTMEAAQNNTVACVAETEARDILAPNGHQTEISAV
jgi:signal transduction histidine kinase